nr:DUF664 domain-containing protein [Phytohabitans rumicis]
MVLPLARGRPATAVGRGGLGRRSRLGLAIGHPRHPEQLFTLWQGAVARSRAVVAEALADGGLDGLARWTWPDGRSPSRRWILCHMIEEYARHNGHADLIRESVDGLTGE